MAESWSLSEGEEDFTFPTPFNDDHSTWVIDSPPLWNLSPARQDDSEEDCFPKLGNKSDRRKSYSGADPKEEKMDMLWEDFNEELTRSRSLKIERRGRITNRAPSDDMGVSVGCNAVKSMKLAKTEKKTSMLVFVKALKKLLRLQNSRRTTKSRSKTCSADVDS